MGREEKGRREEEEEEGEGEGGMHQGLGGKRRKLERTEREVVRG